MNTLRKYIILSLVTASVLGIATSAYAVKLTLNGNTIFYDDFEAGSVGEAFGPVDGAPRWSFNFRGADHKVEVMDATSSGPGASQGEKYGHLTRSGNIGTIARAVNLPPIVDGDLLKVELMVYVPSGQPSFGFYGAFANTADTRGIAMGISASGDVIWDNKDIGGWDITGLSFQFDTWQKWEQDWVVGSTQKTISVGGNSVTVGGADAGGDPITTFYLATISGSNYYVDGVPASIGAKAAPEPSSLSVALVSMGVICASCRTRNRRKQSLRKYGQV